MKIQDYFIIQFKKPELSPQQINLEEKKKKFQEELEEAYSRLESIEILNANTKTKDVFILLQHLLVDLYNTVAGYYSHPLASSTNQIPDLVKNFPIQSLKELFQKNERYLSISSITQPTEEEMELLEEQASKLLSGIEKHIKELKKLELHTPLDDYKKRWSIQGTALVLLLGTIIGSIFYKKIKYPPLKNTTAQVFFLTKSSPAPTPENSAIHPLLAKDKGEWKEYNFSIPGKPQDITGLRIDPVSSSRIRFSISHVRLLDANDKILFERDFRLNQNLLPDNSEQITGIQDVKPGKAEPGRFAELISIGEDPFFFLNLDRTIRGVSKVQLRMRFIEDYNKFLD